MSYEKLKYISIKGNQIFLTTASNNVVPKTYEKWEYMGSGNFSNFPLDFKLFTLCKDMIQGNIQPIPSCNLYLYEWRERECDRYLYTRKQFEHIDELARMNPYISLEDDMINLYHDIQEDILSFRATELLNLAFADKIKMADKNEPYMDYLKKLDAKIDKCFFSGKEETRVQNLKNRTNDILYRLCQIAPQIGLKDEVSWFGDYALYEVPYGKTDKEVWDKVVNKLKEIGTKEPFEKQYRYFVNELVLYPPEYEDINDMDCFLKTLEHPGNMIDKYEEMLKEQEKEEIEEDIDR